MTPHAQAIKLIREALEGPLTVFKSGPPCGSITFDAEWRWDWMKRFEKACAAFQFLEERALSSPRTDGLRERIEGLRIISPEDPTVNGFKDGWNGCLDDVLALIDGKEGERG
jgi:hypothetical protein